jgi:ankyrin repeat protein
MSIIADATEFVEAIQRGDRSFVEAQLAANPALVEAIHERGTPLHFAAIENQKDIVDLLLTAGADLEARDGEFNMTPIGWANEKGHKPMVDYLVARGAATDLYAAVAFGLTDRVRQLLMEDRSQINKPNHYGTPLHEASLWGHADLVRLLLEFGADPSLTNVHGWNALEIAQQQVASGCAATPIVIESRRKEIERGCRAVIALLNSQESQLDQGK